MNAAKLSIALEFLADDSLTFSSLEFVISGVSFTIEYLKLSNEYRIEFNRSGAGATYYRTGINYTLDKIKEIIQETISSIN